jgi:uncharacterized protein Yka (UPF0111/DUF47 family)
MSAMKTAFLPPALCCALLTVNLLASTPDELRAEADKLAEKARQARTEGRPGEAEELMSRVKKLQIELREMISGDEPGKALQTKLQHLKQEAGELHRAGKHEEAERLERQLAEIQQRQAGGDKKASPAEGAERIGHIMEAVKHLRAAGLKEPAQNLEQMARQMREELERRADSAEAGSARQMEQVLREMRERMEKMQREIDELRKQAAKSRGEIEKG